MTRYESIIDKCNSWLTLMSRFSWRTHAPRHKNFNHIWHHGGTTTRHESTNWLKCSGLVDGHTHPVWAGDRVHEFAMKLAGASYMEVTWQYWHAHICNMVPHNKYSKSYIEVHNSTLDANQCHLLLLMHCWLFLRWFGCFVMFWFWFLVDSSFVLNQKKKE